VTDRFDKSKRSAIMSAVHSKDTNPEIIVRKLVHAMGYRYRLHSKGLPGKPDLVFSGKRKVIFVHGCFWHRHMRCPKASTPKTRVDFWQEKFDANVARDKRTELALKKEGWSVLTVWQCELKDIQRLAKRFTDFLEQQNPTRRETLRH
jgi:DNA mismatch endonuclease (patch repair protein)